MCKMNVNLIHLFFVKNTYRKGFFIMSKKLVAFFSASGTTKKVAEMIAEEVKADLFEIEPKVPYTKDDLDWMNKKSRSSVEMSDKKYRPAIMKKEMDMSSYDEILLGFPIWWYVAPTAGCRCPPRCSRRTPDSGWCAGSACKYRTPET